MANIKQGTRLYINLTNACNTNCPFCCMFSGSNKKTYLSFDKFKEIIDSCKDNFELQLEGGEPLLHKNIYLFIEYAISTGRCAKVLILTNGLILDKHLYRLVEIRNYYNIPFEIKISINYWLIKENKNHLKNLNKILFAVEFIPNFKITFNVRKRKIVDEWIEYELKKYELYDHSNIFYLQSYGKMANDEIYEKPIIAQNIKNWIIYSCDGTSFGQDLIARSEYEKTLI